MHSDDGDKCYSCADIRAKSSAVSDNMQKPVDMAFMILGTFAHLLETSAALQCLHSTHAALKPGGILVLELPHPADAFDGSLFEEGNWDEADQQPEEGHVGELAVQYGKAGDHFDPVEQVMKLWTWTRSCSTIHPLQS